MTAFALLLATPPPTGILDGLVDGYQSISGHWLEQILPMARQIFAILGVLEIALSGLLWALQRTTLDQVAAEFVKKSALLSFYFALLIAFPAWIPQIPLGFERAGQVASGTGSLSPSALVDTGITIGNNMMLSFGSLGFLANPSGNILASLTALLVIVSYTAIAAQLTITLVESFVVISAGAITLGFSAFRGTVILAENYINYAVRIGLKIFLLYMLTGVGLALSRQWAHLSFTPDTLVFPPSLAPHFQVMAGAAIFALLTWTIPNSAAAALAGAATVRLHELLR